MKRARLVLARETLARLSPEDLADVNGGESATFYGCPTGYTGLTVCGICTILGVDVTDLRDSLNCPTSPCTS